MPKKNSNLEDLVDFAENPAEKHNELYKSSFIINFLRTIFVVGASFALGLGLAKLVTSPIKSFREKLEKAPIIEHYVVPRETIWGYGVKEGLSNVFPYYYIDRYIEEVRKLNPEVKEHGLRAGYTVKLPDYNGDGKVGMPHK